MPRRYQLQELGLEIFFTGHGTLFLTFRSKQACRDCLRTLQGLPAVQLQKFRSSKKWTQDWVNGKVGLGSMHAPECLNNLLSECCCSIFWSNPRLSAISC